MTLLKFTAPDGVPMWVVMEMVEMLRSSRPGEYHQHTGALSVLHFTSGREVAIKESVEEALAYINLVR